jgi:hypothetical protein
VRVESKLSHPARSPFVDWSPDVKQRSNVLHFWTSVNFIYSSFCSLARQRNAVSVSVISSDAVRSSVAFIFSKNCSELCCRLSPDLSPYSILYRRAVPIVVVALWSSSKLVDNRLPHQTPLAGRGESLLRATLIV